jgi:protein-disulfide isomerase
VRGPERGGGAKPPAPGALAALRHARSPVDEPGHGHLLSWLIGGGLTLLALGMAGTIAFVIVSPRLAARSGAGGAPSGVAPAAPSPLLSGASGSGAAAPPASAQPSLVALPPRAGKPSTYPADHDALVPVEADAVTRGDRDALVTLVVFGDLTCPFTAQAFAQIPALEARFGSDLRVVFKHYPLPGRAEARLTAEASSVLQQVSDEAFWRFVDAATRNGPGLDAERLEELGIKAGAAAGTVTDGLGKHTQRARVDRDVDLGRRLGVRGTPVFFYNGRRLDGLQPPERLASLLDIELRRTRDALSAGKAPRERLYAARVMANITTSEGDPPPGDKGPR